MLDRKVPLVREAIQVYWVPKASLAVAEILAQQEQSAFKVLEAQPASLAALVFQGHAAPWERKEHKAQRAQ